MDLKSKFKTKEDYEAYLSKMKAEVSAKKETSSKKEMDLKSKFKTKEDYEAYLSKMKAEVKSDKFENEFSGVNKKIDSKSKVDSLEKGEVGFWKPMNGKKKLMKDFKVKLKDKDGYDVSGDFSIDKDGKIDLKSLPKGKYYGKLEPVNNKAMSEKMNKSIDTQDILAIARYMGSLENLSETQLIAANIDKSEGSENSIDVKDILAVAKIIGGLKETKDFELRCSSKVADNKSGNSFELREGYENSFESILLGDVDGSFSQTLI